MFPIIGRILRPFLVKRIASGLFLRQAGIDALIVDDNPKARISRGGSTATLFVIEIRHTIGHGDNKLCSKSESSNGKTHNGLHSF